MLWADLSRSSSSKSMSHKLQMEHGLEMIIAARLLGRPCIGPTTNLVMDPVKIMNDDELIFVS